MSPQVRTGLHSAAAATADGVGALASIVTLESQSVVLRMDPSGVRVEAADGEPAATVFDSVNSLLLNTSPGFVAHFNSSLAAALARVAQEREIEDG